MIRLIFMNHDILCGIIFYSVNYPEGGIVFIPGKLPDVESLLVFINYSMQNDYS
jgi:hypothetical protein